ncbi:hypothetical protein [Micromonospora sp. RTP1Z1]|uniref:hypothetical protein n=1 Tax=Micromonospora sp. RTP1Z1 TaxID=2994043 RepID=UPI0029C69E7E|nr:hypothetical protein [Micromonospora sp. RTP1Z1]
MIWPFHHRPEERIDATGPATNYAGHAGALSPAAVREIEARHRAGSHRPTAVDRACDPWAGHNQRGAR